MDETILMEVDNDFAVAEVAMTSQGDGQGDSQGEALQPQQQAATAPWRHPRYDPHATWKYGIFPYEMLFARRITGNRQFCTSRQYGRLDGYYPNKPLTLKDVRDQLGAVTMVYRVTVPAMLRNLALNNADCSQILHWITMAAEAYLDEIFDKDKAEVANRLGDVSKRKQAAITISNNRGLQIYIRKFIEGFCQWSKGRGLPLAVQSKDSVLVTNGAPVRFPAPGGYHYFLRHGNGRVEILPSLGRIRTFSHMRQHSTAPPLTVDLLYTSDPRILDHLSRVQNAVQQALQSALPATASQASSALLSQLAQVLNTLPAEFLAEPMPTVLMEEWQLLVEQYRVYAKALVYSDPILVRHREKMAKHQLAMAMTAPTGKASQIARHLLHHMDAPLPEGAVDLSQVLCKRSQKKAKLLQLLQQSDDLQSGRRPVPDSSLTLKKKGNMPAMYVAADAAIAGRGHLPKRRKVSREEFFLTDSRGPEPSSSSSSGHAEEDYYLLDCLSEPSISNHSPSPRLLAHIQQLLAAKGQADHFSQSAVLAMAVMFEESIKDFMQDWHRTGCAVPWSESALRREVHAQCQGGQPDAKELRGTLEALFNRDLSTYTDLIEIFRKEVKPSSSEQRQEDKAAPVFLGKPNAFERYAYLSHLPKSTNVRAWDKQTKAKPSKRNFDEMD